MAISGMICGNVKTIPDKGEASVRRKQTQIAEAGVLLWVEEVMLGEQAWGLKTKSLWFFLEGGWVAQNEVLKTSFHISFNMLLKMSHKKQKLLKNGIFEML